MTKLQELLLSGGSRHGTKYISHTVEAKPLEGVCIMTAKGWRSFNRPTVNHNQQPDDGRYRDGFITRDNVRWSHASWAAYRLLQQERIEMSASRINRHGHEKFTKPSFEKVGRFDKWGVKVMT